MKKIVKAGLLISLMNMLILVGCKTVEETGTTSDIKVSINKRNNELVKNETLFSGDKEEILKGIDTKFALLILKDEIYQGDIYILPEEGEVVVNGEAVKDTIIWDKEAVTDTPGKYMYEGHTKLYNRDVNLTLNVKKNIYDRKIVYIRNIYEDENSEYILIEFDEAEFYRGDKALEEAVKDEQMVVDENGKYSMISNYYVRNSSYDIVSYKVSSFPVYELLENEINELSNRYIDLVNVDYDTLKEHIDNYKDSEEEDKLLFWIDIKNDKVTSIVRQHVGYDKIK